MSLGASLAFAEGMATSIQRFVVARGDALANPALVSGQFFDAVADRVSSQLDDLHLKSRRFSWGLLAFLRDGMDTAALLHLAIDPSGPLLAALVQHGQSRYRADSNTAAPPVFTAPGILVGVALLGIAAQVLSPFLSVLFPGKSEIPLRPESQHKVFLGCK